MCSHPRTGDATDENIAEKNREKFNELNFLRQNHGLRQRVATQAIFAARWRRDNFKKIASPSQAKNRSCSRGITATLKHFLALVTRCFSILPSDWLTVLILFDVIGPMSILQLTRAQSLFVCLWGEGISETRGELREASPVPFQ